MDLYINGATGFIGSWLVRHFAAQGWSVLASGRSEPPSDLLALARYQRADIRHPMPPVQTDAVVHVAALASDSAPMSALVSTNVEGTRRVFYATQDCPVFIYISSSSVYDYRQVEHREDEPSRRDKHGRYPLLSPYGCSKRLSEDWLLEQDWRHRSLIILRPRAVYGPGDRQLLPRLMRLVRGDRILLPGDMRVSTSLTYVGNLASAVQASWRYAEKHATGVHIFNVADAEPYELREVTCRLLSAVYEHKLSVCELPLSILKVLAGLGPYLPFKVPLTPLGLSSVSQSNVLNLEKTKATLLYQPSVSFWDVLPEINTWVH